MPSIQRSFSAFKQLRGVSLYSNTFYLMVSNGAGALMGFVYWIAAARLYPAAEVGLASAAIAAMGLLGTLSHFGFGLGLIRFLPGWGERGKLVVNACLTFAALAAVAVSLVFMLGLECWSPGLASYRENTLKLAVFVLFTVFTALNSITDNVLIARRASVYVMIRNLVFAGVKLMAVALFAATLASYGIFASWGIALAVSLLLSLGLFLPRAWPGYTPMPALMKKGMGKLARFSLGNNAAYFLFTAPSSLLPIFILERLGAEPNAYFYAAWAIVMAVSMGMTSISMSLFAEGSNEEGELIAYTWRSLGMALVVAVPVVILLVIFAEKILLAYGAAYSGNATRLLQLLAVSILPLTVNQIYYGNIRVRKRIKTLVVIAGLLAMSTLLVSYLLLPELGILAAGIGWLVSQTLVTLWVIISGKRGLVAVRAVGAFLSRRNGGGGYRPRT